MWAVCFPSGFLILTLGQRPPQGCRDHKRARGHSDPTLPECRTVPVGLGAGILGIPAIYPSRLPPPSFARQMEGVHGCQMVKRAQVMPALVSVGTSSGYLGDLRHTDLTEGGPPAGTPIPARWPRLPGRGAMPPRPFRSTFLFSPCESRKAPQKS